MINSLKILFLILSISIFFLLFPTVAFAVSFTLDEPTGPFSQGQEAQYTINIDTDGATLTSTEANMTYDTQYLEYLSTSPGALFPNVSGTVVSAGNLRIAASVNAGEAGITGAGTFAFVNFRLIGSPQSDVELCALATPTPTSAPTTLPQATTTPQLITSPALPPQESLPPVRTLPRSGTPENLLIIGALGVAFTSFGALLRKINR